MNKNLFRSYPLAYTLMKQRVITRVPLTVLLLATSLLVSAHVMAQPAPLTSGDIAIIQYRTDDNDGFGFVALVNIATGTEIKFTDKGWDGSHLARGEDVWLWTAVSSLNAGSVVTCQSNGCNTGDLSLPEGATDITGLSGDGDQIIAFQGSIRSPVFIYALSTMPWRTSGDIDNHTSYLPLGLIDETTAIAFSSHLDNGHFNIADPVGTKFELLTLNSNPNNWARENTRQHPFYPPSFWSYRINGPVITAAAADPSQPITPPCISGVLGDPTDPARLSGLVLMLSDANATVTATADRVGDKPYADPDLELNGTGAERQLSLIPSAVGYAIITIRVTDGNGNTNAMFLLYATSPEAKEPAQSRFHTGASDASTAIAIDDQHMLVGNDEDQKIRLYHRQLSGLPLYSFTPSAQQLGLTDRDGDGVPREVDIEASIRDGSRIYWIGSHGNSNRQEDNLTTNPGGECRPNRSRMVATDLTGSGASAALRYAGRYDHLRDDLINWDQTNGHGQGAAYYGFEASAHCVESGTGGLWPKRPDGFNIEGLAWTPNSTTTAYVAFRAPLVPTSDRTKALIVPVTNFSDLLGLHGGAPGSAQFGSPIEMDLGALGIRSLTRHDANQYLILAGAIDNTNVFQLFTWTGNPEDRPQLRITEPDLTTFNEGEPDGSYEALVVPVNSENTDFDSEGTILHLLVDNGRSDWYDDGVESKRLPGGLQKFRRDEVTLGPGVEVDLSISKRDDVDPVVAGNILMYRITVSNAGPDEAQRVVVEEMLPAGVTFISTSGCANDPAGVPICNLGNIVAGDSAQFTVQVMIHTDTTGTISNRATVNSDTTDVDPSNNRVTEDTTVSSPPSLTITDIAVYHPALGNWHINYSGVLQ